MISQSSISISLDHIENGLTLFVDARRKNSLFDAKGSASQHNEARFQLVEGCFYDYKLSLENYYLGDVDEGIIQRHKRSNNLGTIAPNIYVGTLSIPLFKKEDQKKCAEIELEVQSIKTDYRDDYRDMLAFITERCTDLLLKSNSSVSQHFDIDYTKNSQTLYQKFAFLKSIINTEEFNESIHRIVTTPVTQWMLTREKTDIRNIRRFSNKNIKEITKGRQRIKTVTPIFGISSLPQRITSIHKTDSVDTPENRFVKYVLEVFLKFCVDINNTAKKYSYKQLATESDTLILSLENHLHHSIFKDISQPLTLKLNNPVLQRKEGYREVLRTWLMFDLAAKLIWSGGDDIYKGGKKDIATLYEYWLFFKLLELFETLFDLKAEDINELIVPTKDGLNLTLKQGKHTALFGIYDSGTRKLNIRFNYNRSFGGTKEYPHSGSWTTTLRPDYTLSIWPRGISENEAETQELIVHIHFDAKYKVANLNNLLEQKSESELDDEKIAHKKGIYKNADLLKMHAYKDAIRRTGGAYVLYPGGENIEKRGFHEIIPGLGAFPVKPSKTGSGISVLKSFILEVLEHFINRTSQREKLAYRTYDIHKSAPKDEDIIKESLPEPYNENRHLIPDETFVLIGYYPTTAHLDWHQKNKKYNFRMDSRRGSLVLDKETVSAEYLLLHTKDDQYSGNLWKIKSRGPRVFSKEKMEALEYPNPKGDYLVIEIEPVLESELLDKEWNFKKLKNYKSFRGSALPFTASLSELMTTVIK